MSPTRTPDCTEGRAARTPSWVVVALRRLSDLAFDWVHGTDTADPVEPGALRVTGPHRERGIRYQITRPRAFRRVLRELDLPPGEVFVDIGCGKGLVLLLAREFGFRRIVGVEYAPALCEIARRNLEVAGGPDPSRFAVHCCDAADYDFREEESVIYLFNPFDSFVLERVMAQLAASLARNPRRAWLIYHFPRWHAVVERSGLFAAIATQVDGDSEFIIYRHEPRAKS